MTLELNEAALKEIQKLAIQKDMEPEALISRALGVYFSLMKITNNKDKFTIKHGKKLTKVSFE